MELHIKQMEYNEGKIVMNWRYDEPFSIYNMEDSKETLEELINGTYYSVYTSKTLIGYFCFGESAQIPIGKKYGAYDLVDFIDIGLGMDPGLCGQKLGYNFLEQGLKFAKRQFSSNNFRLTVAAFNQRAIKVYSRIGFKKVLSFERILGKEKIIFDVMLRRDKTF